jgi:hypothetical protein
MMILMMMMNNQIIHSKIEQNKNSTILTDYNNLYENYE